VQAVCSFDHLPAIFSHDAGNYDAIAVRKADISADIFARSKKGKAIIFVVGYRF